MTDLTEMSGAQLATMIRRAKYDPDFLVGYFVTLAGHIADDDWPGGSVAAARKALERLADFDKQATENPWVVRQS